MRIGFDIDGTLTLWSPHFGGLGAVGKASWWCLRQSGVGEWMMRHTPERDWLCEVVRKLAAAGAEIHLVTAREERYRTLTVDWMCRHNLIPSWPDFFPYDRLHMLPQGADLIDHKARWAARMDWYVDDQREVLDGVAVLLEHRGQRSPRLLNSTHQQAEILKLAEEAACV